MNCETLILVIRVSQFIGAAECVVAVFSGSRVTAPLKNASKPFAEALQTTWTREVVTIIQNWDWNRSCCFCVTGPLNYKH